MNGNNIFEQERHFAVIGAVMMIISLLFLFYMGSSLIDSTKKYLMKVQSIELISR